MILPRGKNVVYLFLLFCNILRICYSEDNDHKYEFGGVELYTIIEPDQPQFGVRAKGMQIIKGWTDSMDYENLCDRAKEYASLDGLYFNHRIYSSKALNFSLINMTNELNTYAQICDTIPISYVRYDEGDKTLKVLISQNEFENREKYTIEVENIKSTPVPRIDIMKTAPLPESWKKRMDDDFTPENRLDICLAAKKQVQRNFDGVKPRMLHTDVGKTAIYTIQSLDGTKRNRIAIQCPSYPQMYVHFENNYQHMVAVFVENELKKEDLQVPSTQKDTPSGLPLKQLEDIRREYKFETETNYAVYPCNKTYQFLLFSNNPGYDFYKFNDDELRSLCIVAKEKASLDGLVDTANIYDRNKFYIPYPQAPPSYKRMCVIAVKCKTIPISYLRLGQSEDEIKIVIEKNPYLEEDHRIEVEMIKSQPILVRIVSPKRFSIPGFDREPKYYEKEKKEDSISRIHSSLRLMICVAARTIVRQQKLGEPVLKSSVVEEPQTYEFKLSKGIQTESAVECPSLPVMFVYFDQSPKNIKVILLKK